MCCMCQGMHGAVDCGCGLLVHQHDNHLVCMRVSACPSIASCYCFKCRCSSQYQLHHACMLITVRSMHAVPGPTFRCSASHRAMGSEGGCRDTLSPGWYHPSHVQPQGTLEDGASSVESVGRRTRVHVAAKQNTWEAAFGTEGSAGSIRTCCTAVQPRGGVCAGVQLCSLRGTTCRICVCVCHALRWVLITYIFGVTLVIWCDARHAQALQPCLRRQCPTVHLTALPRLHGDHV